MEEIKRLSDDVIEQIKDFNHEELTEEQKLIINELILDKGLKFRYKNFGLCDECNQPKTDRYWCRLCNFQRNFKNWTSGNEEIDKFIQKIQLKATYPKELLEWIEYDRFEDVRYLDRGGFGTTYKAIWKDGPIDKWDPKNNQWIRIRTCGNHLNYPVALKRLHNSKNFTTEFLREIELHISIVNSGYVVQCFGITKDPESGDFMMVMQYIQHGNLRQHLNSSFNSLSWSKKLYHLSTITYGLRSIHNKGLIHHDFHCGNILNNGTYSIITDLGLCKPTDEKTEGSNKKIYGVLPYVAPEVLRGRKYTQASDIYGFGIIAHEICTGYPTYHDIAHDEFLAIKICKGRRPKSNYKVPQLILDMIQKCWNADPLKRPSADVLHSFFRNLHHSSTYEEDSLINKQIKEADEINKSSSSTSLLSTNSTSALSYSTHTQAIYTSRLLDFQNLPEPKNADSGDVETFETSCWESLKIDFSELSLNSKETISN